MKISQLKNNLKIIVIFAQSYKNKLYICTQITCKKIEIMTAQDYNDKANELNAKFPNLKAEVITGWDGNLEIKVCNSDKAKTLRELYRNFNFTF